MALSACGTEATPTSNPPPSAAQLTPRDAIPTPIASTPATPAFLARAHAVAQLVRSVGIPTPPTGIFLRSSRTPGLAFDTTEQKLAWSAGQIVIAPGVNLRSAAPSQITFADGSTIPANTLNARHALAAAIGTTKTNCRGIPAASCLLTITGASPGTTEVVTSKGPATVPTWSFTVKNLSRPIVVIAVPEEILRTPVEPIPPPGLTKLEPGLLQVQSLTKADGNTLTFVLGHGRCEPNLQAHIVEFEDLVIIGGSHAPPPTTGCDDAGASTPATATLTTPLGNRPIITASTGTRLTPLN